METHREDGIICKSLSSTAEGGREGVGGEEMSKRRMGKEKGKERKKEEEEEEIKEKLVSKEGKKRNKKGGR